jgi:hypothetical protein
VLLSFWTARYSSTRPGRGSSVLSARSSSVPLAVDHPNLVFLPPSCPRFSNRICASCCVELTLNSSPAAAQIACTFSFMRASNSTESAWSAGTSTLIPCAPCRGGSDERDLDLAVHARRVLELGVVLDEQDDLRGLRGEAAAVREQHALLLAAAERGAEVAQRDVLERVPLVDGLHVVEEHRVAGDVLECEAAAPEPVVQRLRVVRDLADRGIARSGASARARAPLSGSRSPSLPRSTDRRRDRRRLARPEGRRAPRDPRCAPP